MKRVKESQERVQGSVTMWGEATVEAVESLLSEGLHPQEAIEYLQDNLDEILAEFFTGAY